MEIMEPTYEDIRKFMEKKVANARKNLDLSGLEGMTRSEIAIEIRRRLDIQVLPAMYDIHEMIWDVPCGPTLGMLPANDILVHFIREM